MNSLESYASKARWKLSNRRHLGNRLEIADAVTEFHVERGGKEESFVAIKSLSGMVLLSREELNKICDWARETSS